MCGGVGKSGWPMPRLMIAAALLLQAGRARQHLERALGAEPAHGRGELHRIVASRLRRARMFATGSHRRAIAVAGGRARMDWFEERLHANWRQGIRVKEVLYRERTELQDLVIFESHDWGRVLALDGVVQTTTGDEFCYHEMIVHVPILAHGARARGADHRRRRRRLPARGAQAPGRGAGHPGRDRRRRDRAQPALAAHAQRRRLRPPQGARGHRRRRPLRRRVPPTASTW